MSIKLLAQTQIEGDHFSSATEQDGEYCEQPMPATTNEGSLRPLVDRFTADFVINSTTTGNGASNGTTIYDTGLSIFGDDFFIGGTITINDGASPANGQERDITFFVRSVGQVTVSPGFSDDIPATTDYILTVYFSTRDFRLVLIDGGDPGEASFKWSHNGGSVWLGRNNPNQATWLAFDEAFQATSLAAGVSIVELANGDWMAVYDHTGGTPGFNYRISADKGMTWGALGTVTTTSNTVPYGVVRLSTGRILISAGVGKVIYSDDDGDSWVEVSSNDTVGGHLVELPSGNLVKLYDTGNSAFCRLSVDGGFNWSDAIAVADKPTSSQRNPKGCVNAIGDVVAVFSDDSESAAQDEIKARISSDGGATWGSDIDVINYSGGVLRYPHVCLDIDGSLYCVAEDTTNDYLVFARSADHGETWDYVGILYNHASTWVVHPLLHLLDGNVLLCSLIDYSSSDAEFVRRGMWEYYSGNESPCAVSSIGQSLVSGVTLYWHGGEGKSDDSWSFQAAYEFAMENIIYGSPSVPFRSVQDNIDLTILLDMGASVRLLIDTIAIFGANIRTLGLMMNNSLVCDSTTPVDETISFDEALLTLDDVQGNYVKDASVLAGYKDHELIGYYARATSGGASGNTWKIIDNVGSWIALDTTISTGMSSSDTMAVFARKVFHSFVNGTPYRYIRLEIGAQITAEEYYQLGEVVLGKTITLGRGWSAQYSMSTILGRNMIRTPLGLVKATQYHDPYVSLDLTWAAAGEDYTDLNYLLQYIGANNMVIVPNHNTPRVCYLMTCVTDVQANRVYENEWGLKLKFEEVL